MLRPLVALAVSIVASAPLALAQSADGDLVRLPSHGTVKSAPPGQPLERYVPGGGLILSFDNNRDGYVTPAERDAGIERAFAIADANNDGCLSALEQQSWAESLPTRDDSLANPVRFDPNLDRFVSAEEFSDVVDTIADAYVDPISGNIAVAALKAPSQDGRKPETLRRVRALPDRVNF